MNSEGSSKGPSATRRTVLVIGLILLLGLVIGVVVGIMRFQAGQRALRVTFPDGTRVELLGTAIGGEKFTTEKAWQRVARRFLPKRFQNWIPAPFTVGGHSVSYSNDLMIYLRFDLPAGSPAGTKPWADCQPEDATGFRYPRPTGSSFNNTGPGSVVHCLMLSSYPRRQPGFMLRFQDRSGADIATLRVPNPVKGPFPDWQPAPMPQTRTNGPVSVTLQALSQGGTTAWPAAYARLRVEAKDQVPRDEWPAIVWFLDATGNGGTFLSRQEPAWKVHTHVSTPIEKFVLTNLTIPAAGDFVSLDQSTNCDGVSIKVLLLAGPGKLTIKKGVSRSMTSLPETGYTYSTSDEGNLRTESWGSPKPFLLVEVRNAQADDTVQLGLRDELGQETKISDSTLGRNYGMAQGAAIWFLEFSPPTDKKSQTFIIILNHPLLFEFMVNPADIQPKP